MLCPSLCFPGVLLQSIYSLLPRIPLYILQYFCQVITTSCMTHMIVLWECHSLWMLLYTFLHQGYGLAVEGIPVVPWIWYLLGCFVLVVVSLVPILLPSPVLPLFSSLKWLLFSASWPLADLLVLVVSCKFLFGNFLSVILSHIGTRSPLFFYIGGMIMYVGTSRIICESGVYMIPVGRSGRIIFSWSSPNLSFILICTS